MGGALAATVLIAAMTPAGSGQAAPPTMSLGEHLAILTKYGENYLERLRPEVVQRLSAGGQTLLKLAEDSDDLRDLAAARQRQGVRVQGPRAARPGFANDTYAAEDFYSRLTGMTQSETTAGWCGSNALIGWNDSGSFVSTAFLAESPSGSLSFNGWARSTDAGRHYTDRGALVADPIPGTLMFRDLLGDPVIGCTSPQNFYFASLAVDTAPGGTSGTSDITVSASTDGGTTFAPAVAASAKDAELHFLDKPWMAVEPGPTSAASDDVLHVAYLDIDLTGLAGAGGPCPDQAHFALEYVRSTDGGRTWTTPAILDEACELDASLQAAQVETGPGDTVYVGWERFAADGAAREIRIRRSADLGATFAPAATVAPVTGIGDGNVLQGQFRTGLDLQGLAVDQSRGPRRGTVYVTYHDGSARQKPDPAGFCNASATYCFGDIQVVRSTDGGTTWSAPVRVNNDDPALGIDQWFPAVDVDSTGAVWTTYYDRRRDDRNFLIDTFVARSGDGGATWSNRRATATQFPPVTGWQDVVVNPAYMGDYIAIATDATGRNPGAIAAWGDNALGDANVGQRKFER
ncbi:sialidase family protein [Nucisporomicrobium flavum]|uniref:sialidase family protein n=1 Tax=Nucisporomicrobium flavum TaxID=2785915 RepID=UPI0018F4B0D7|nr:sialidase family protein [Nucisporomicrobium flavum]